MKAYDIKKGNVVEHNGTVYQVRDIERSSPQGRGGNVKFRFTMYSVPGGTKFDLSLGGDDELKEVELSRRQATYLVQGRRRVRVPRRRGLHAVHARRRRGRRCRRLHRRRPHRLLRADHRRHAGGAAAAASVAIEVVETPPELKGGTATKRPKPAKLSTGIEIQVPEYIGNGERVLGEHRDGRVRRPRGLRSVPLWERRESRRLSSSPLTSLPRRCSISRQPLHRHPPQRRIGRFVIRPAPRSRATRGHATRR